MKRWLQRGAGAVGVPLLATLAGFAWFVIDATRPASPHAPRADGIVALTGGDQRVATALRLLAQGAAPKLLLSGAGRGVELRDVARLYGADADGLAARVAIGHDAADTHGNAEETAAWARAQGIRTLIVVTSGYHMRRATLELARALPGVTLYPVPVQPGGGVTDPRLYVEEYVKWLVVTALPDAAPARRS